MKEQQSSTRIGFPKTGDLISVIRFLTGVQDHACVYIGRVKGSDRFNFAQFSEPVKASPEQQEILKAVDAVVKLASASK